MKNNIKILGIDPGLTNTGYNISTYSPLTGIIEVKQYDVISAIKIAKKLNKQDYNKYGSIIPLQFYEEELNRILSAHKPDYVVSESAFYCSRTPNAFASLSLCINAIERVLYNYGKTLYKIAPREAKVAVSTGKANKIAVQEAILNLPDLNIKRTKSRNIENMVEHEADSIAITYAFVKNILPGIHL